MSEYAPTTDEVRNASAGSLNYITFDEFDCWFAGELAKKEAEVRAHEREMAVGDAIDRISSACFNARHQKHGGLPDGPIDTADLLQYMHEYEEDTA